MTAAKSLTEKLIEKNIEHVCQYKSASFIRRELQDVKKNKDKLVIEAMQYAAYQGSLLMTTQI